MRVKTIREITAALILAAPMCSLTARDVLAQMQKAAPSPAAGTMWLYPERIRLQDGGLAVADRGYLFASANRDDPKSEVIGVEVYRFRAEKTADPATPPIFFLHGGPNFAGLEPGLARPGYYEREIKPYLAVADFVVVGQRGIGSSKPTTTCQRPAGVAIDAALDQRARVVAEAAARCKEFWSRSGLDVKGLTVMQAAADVDDVRKALGYDTIQIWGGSFGSHWGIAVLRYYPQTVARMVLRGLEGPDNTYDSPAGDAVRDIAVTGARAWPALVLALHKGDYTAAARAAIQARTWPGIQTGSYYVLDCGSGITPRRNAAFLADPAVAVVGEINWEYRVACPVWGNDNGETFRANLETSVPTVMVQGDWDTSTPIENARELAPFFRNSRFVLVKGGSHGSLSEAQAASPELRRQLLSFFATGDMAGIPDRVVLPSVKWVVP